MDSVYSKLNTSTPQKKANVMSKKMGFNSKPNTKMGHSSSTPISKIGHNNC